MPEKTLFRKEEVALLEQMLESSEAEFLALYGRRRIGKTYLRRYVPKKNTKEDGAQIDLLFDRPDDAITCCEIKYSNQPYAVDKSCADNLVRRASVLKTQTRTHKQIFW